MVALALSVFIVVRQFAQLGSDGLNDAIEAESGALGTYVVETQENFGLDPDAFVRKVLEVLEPFASTPMTYVVGYPELRSECPPYQREGLSLVRFAYRANGQPYPVDFGSGLPAGTRFCVAGSSIPRSALTVLPPESRNVIGSGVVMHDRYRPFVEIATSAPIAFRFVLTTGKTDLSLQLDRALRSEFEPVAAKHGLAVGPSGLNDFAVSRIDAGDGVRSASQGVSTVFTVVSWGVLILAAAGLLITQLLSVRQRFWFFGLALAMGARRTQIMLLVLLEIAVVVALGLALTVALVAAVSPIANRFGRETFGLSVDLASASSLSQLALGAGLTLMALKFSA